jgi:hypothetical protein
MEPVEIAVVTEELIHTHPAKQFKLYRRPHRSNDSWISLKLIRPLGKKRNWWLGWNGERLAKNHDAMLLFKHEPEIYQWVINTLSAHGEFHVKPVNARNRGAALNGKDIHRLSDPSRGDPARGKNSGTLAQPRSRSRARLGTANHDQRNKAG